MKRRSLGLVFLGVILIITFPTLNANMETAITGGNTMVTAIRLLVTVGVIGASVLSLGLAAYEEFMR